MPSMKKTNLYDLLGNSASSAAEEEAAEIDFNDKSLLAAQMNLLGIAEGRGSGQAQKEGEKRIEEMRSAPLFSAAVAMIKPRPRRGESSSRSRIAIFPQYGLLAARKDISPRLDSRKPAKFQDPRIYLNVNAPWSAFICGSQGSGKSHSLSCMLENCLLPHPNLGRLRKPLSALVFHYDSFTSAAGGQVSEAAYLCSSGLPVTVLVSPTNLTAMKALYTKIPGLPTGASRPVVLPFLLHERYLNVGRLMALMAAGTVEGPMPLYMQTVLQVLREMAMKAQATESIGIDYAAFKRRILAKDLAPGQLGPLNLRLELLESFIKFSDPLAFGVNSKKKSKGNDWTHAPGSLTIVDLSCPFVDSDTACALFEMCLGIFLEQKMDVGRVIVLDEAHKFMGPTSTSSQKLTDSLVDAIRLQRHLACRVIIATQEPTISPSLLDLCSITLVHRFSSPEWMSMLRGHLAAAATAGAWKKNLAAIKEDREKESDGTANLHEEEIFEAIVNLSVGEALLFAPAAMLDLVSVGGGVCDGQTDSSGGEDEPHEVKSADEAEVGGDSGGEDEEDEEEREDDQGGEKIVDGEDEEADRPTLIPQKLGAHYLRIRIRDRVTADGGRSRCTYSAVRHE